MKIDVSALAALAREVETEDGIDWRNLKIDEAGAYNLIALGVAAQYEEEWSKLPQNDKEISMLAVITKLLVENFVINLKHMD